MRATFGEMVPDAVAAELKEGVAERTLVDLSADADLLVLGSGSPAAEPAGPGIDYLGLVRMAENKAQGVGEIAYVEVTLPGFPEREVAE